MSKDKEYIVDKKIDATLTEEDLKKIRQKKKPVGKTLAYNRQDIFIDRRDPLANKKPHGPDRRKNKKERRDLDPD